MNIPNQFVQNEIVDYGPEPFVANIHQMAIKNNYFRTALWTGKHMQMTLMTIPVRGEIGLELHSNLEQFLYIESGKGIVKMGSTKEKLNYQKDIYNGMGIFIPANTWHNLINTSNVPIKLFSIYAPPQHPFGTIHQTKEIADAAEHEYH